MKNLVARAAVVLGGLWVSSIAFAQGAADGAGSDWLAIGAGFAAAIAVGLATFAAATGQGRTATAALEGIARNPNAKDAIFQPFILGLVFMELQALLGFVIAIIWTFKVG